MKEIGEKDKKWLRVWFISGAVLVTLILIVGGITRLTGSGLSMTDWKPIMGSIPPITEAQWEEAFDQYKQFPEYQQINRGMSLGEFQFIFFWEYLHRMLGRLIGIVFLVPFIYFVAKKKLNTKWLKRSVWLLILGGSQGLMGWYMVQSGLVDLPYVSPYRLTAHLLLAFTIFAFCVWYAADLTKFKREMEPRKTELSRWLYILFGVIVVQVAWGALVAGLDAGHVYNTFPKMYQYWIPPEVMALEPWYQNFTENSSMVQFIHRALATAIGLMAIGYWVRLFMVRSSKSAKLWGGVIFALVLIQYTLGVFTLITHVQIALGVLHQFVALLLVGAMLVAIYSIKQNRAQPAL
ncbi:COX15/CtaA family protein [Rhodohalobacter halophilus]|uniref:COX15/CtaA family protein n=1 Tax=Rhodohalobacter halophilus TaxID=1812810 RepID=UPI00083FA44C|nr:COX15/CtaA family protein [Rhodohalobacter halophilus]